MNAFEAARKLWHCQDEGCAFPLWTLDRWSSNDFSKTILFHHAYDNPKEVYQLATFREPVNIAMNRSQDESAMMQIFGYNRGLQKEGSPNFAIQCHANVKFQNRFRKVHVLNVIGCALDSREQPDYRFQNSHAKVLQFQIRMWTLAAQACRSVGLSKMQVQNVGGGAFAGPQHNFVEQVFEPTIQEVIRRGFFRGIEILGYDFDEHEFQNDQIPRDLFSNDDASEILQINAWDPWSMVGNGNACDASLDGYWGRSSNVAVLCWPPSNPHMQVVGLWTESGPSQMT